MPPAALKKKTPVAHVASSTGLMNVETREKHIVSHARNTHMPAGTEHAQSLTDTAGSSTRRTQKMRCHTSQWRRIGRLPPGQAESPLEERFPAKFAVNNLQTVRGRHPSAASRNPHARPITPSQDTQKRNSKQIAKLNQENPNFIPLNSRSREEGKLSAAGGQDWNDNYDLPNNSIGNTDGELRHPIKG